MPGVDIYTRHEPVGGNVADPLKATVRQFVMKRFSVRNITLTEKDFSFKFHESSVHDDLTNDVIVRIRLHAFPERLSEGSDRPARQLAQQIVNALRDTGAARNEVTVGVELLFAEIGWGSASSKTVIVAPD